MTAVNCWRFKGEGVVMTDTAHMDIRSGEVLAFGSKAFVAADRFPAVVAATFFGGSLDMLIEHFLTNTPKNGRALVRAMPEALAWFQGRAREAGSIAPTARILAVYWCAKARAVKQFYCSTDADLVAAFKPVELDFYIGTGLDSPVVQGLAQHLKAGRGLDPATDGVKLLEAQRRAPFQATTPSLMGHYCVGGAIERATVSRRGVELSIDRQWPDQVGARIDPAIMSCAAADVPC